MSDLYINLTPKPSIDVPGRSCAVCGKPVSAGGQVFLPTAELPICKGCAHDLYVSLAPNAEAITVNTSMASPKRVIRKADTPFDEGNYSGSQATGKG